MLGVVLPLINMRRIKGWIASQVTRYTQQPLATDSASHVGIIANQLDCHVYRYRARLTHAWCAGPSLHALLTKARAAMCSAMFASTTRLLYEWNISDSKSDTTG